MKQNTCPAYFPKTSRRTRMRFVGLNFVYGLFVVIFCASIEASDEQLSERQKLLIAELVSLTGEMEAFQQKVRNYYHELIFLPAEKMFNGTILENDPGALRVMSNAIDAVIDREFNEGAGLKNVHYQTFSAGISEEELEVLIKFYRTDLGKKVLDSNAGLFEEWEKNRNAWAMSLRGTVRKNVKLRLNEYHEKKLEENNGSTKQ